VRDPAGHDAAAGVVGLKTFAPLLHSPPGGPWAVRPARGLRRRTRPAARRGVRGAVRHLVRRYLAAFGPASVPDIAGFTLLTMPVVRAAVDALADEGGIEASAFGPRPDATWAGLAAALTELLADRDPAVYRRYAHRSRELPTAEVRLLAG
jgi:Winged helix DNA-binding domain